MKALFDTPLLCMDLLRQDPPDLHAGEKASKRFCLLYCALEHEAVAQGNQNSWRAKPKLHQLAELMQFSLQDSGTPDKWWTHKDEDWGGWLANTAVRRGGRNVPATTALTLNLLQRFRACLHKLVA